MESLQGQSCTQPFEVVVVDASDDAVTPDVRAAADSAPGLTVSTRPLARLRDGDPALLHVIAPTSVDLLQQDPTLTACPLADSRTSRAIRRRRRLGNLSPREWEVLELLASGLGTVKVARRLYLSPITVRHHVQGILATLGVHRRIDAVLAWVESLRCT